MIKRGVANYYKNSLASPRVSPRGSGHSHRSFKTDRPVPFRGSLMGQEVSNLATFATPLRGQSYERMTNSLPLASFPAGQRLKFHHLLYWN